MAVQTETNRIFRLDMDIEDPIQKMFFSLVKQPIEHVLAFPRLNSAYAEIARMKDARPFADKVLDLLGISPEIADEDIARLEAAKGPVIIVANHPFGGIEGIVLASLLRSLRCDVKFLANSLLNRVPEMRDLLIPVNPFKQRSAVRENIGPIRECIQWVRSGGMLVVFPAGEVSHFDLRKGAVIDPPWSPTIARIIRKTGASVLPLFFPGTNSPGFHLAGAVHPLLRTALLPNELLNKKNRSIVVRTGESVAFEKLSAITRDEEMMEYLRMRTYLLDHKAPGPDSGNRAPLPRKHANASRPVIPPQPSPVLAREIAHLAPSQILVENGDHLVIQSAADQIPGLLLEIGRLREVTFRAVGEGTGNAVDLDAFDQAYIHLFIWNRASREIVGAYRLGRTDEIVRRQGVRGIYTSTLFHYDLRLLKRLGPALELGRSFIRPEYQRSYAPLLLLWKGIGRYLVENPHYRVLFGPVSITNEYQSLSRQLIVRYLLASCFRGDMAGLVRPRKPLKTKPVKAWDIDAALRPAQDDIDDISALVSSIERDGKGVPILLKQYLKLGGEILGFNVDPAFGNVLDGLIMVDLEKTPLKMLERYLGKEGARSFRDYHHAVRSEAHGQAAS
jgi:putative hemolysin